MTTIRKGANAIVNRPFKQANGTALTIASVDKVSLRLIQNGAVVAEYVLGTDDELQVGDDGSSIDFEVSAALTETLSVGTLVEEWAIEDVNAAFTVDLKSIAKVVVEDIFIDECPVTPTP